MIPALAIVLAPVQCHELKVLPEPETGAYLYGHSLAADGDWLLVGAAANATFEQGAGHAYVRTPDGWALRGLLKASDGQMGDELGSDVDLSGNLALLGAPYEKHDGLGQAVGAAYLFERGETSWHEVQKLIATPGGQWAFFGDEVAFAGEQVLVGSPSGYPDTGGVYVFEEVAGTWTQVDVLRPSDERGGKLFARGLACDGDRLAVGRPTSGISDPPGMVFVYERSGSTWSEVAVLDGADHGGTRAFGEEVALEGDRVVVGDPERGPKYGAVQVFERVGSTWTPTELLRSEESIALQRFGFSLCLDGDRLAVGGPALGDTLGGAWIFEHAEGSWERGPRLTALDQAPHGYDRYGFAVELVDGGLLVGAPDAAGHEDRTGAFYALTEEPGDPYCDAAATSLGEPAELFVTGCPSITTNELVLHAAPVPPQTGLFFYGDSQAEAPFGNGFRCVAPPFFRLPVVAAAGGELVWELDVTSPPAADGQITAGSTWYFQAWFRDSAAGGAFFNLSRGLELLFQP